MPLSASPVAFARRQLGEFYPESYGALGDGSTDDSTAIQNAINAANAVGGGTIRFTPGKTYAIGSQLVMKSGVSLVGGSDFMYCATLKATSATMNHVVFTATTYGVTLKGLRLDAASRKSAGTAIYAGSGNSVGRLVVEDVLINNCYDALELNAGNGIWLTRVDVNAPVRHGLRFLGTFNMIEVHLTDLYLEGSYSTGQSSGSGIYWYGDALYATNCTIIGFAIGVECKASHGWWNNVFCDACDYCWVFDGLGCGFHNLVNCGGTACTLTGAPGSFPTGHSAIQFKNGSGYISIVGGDWQRGLTMVEIGASTQVVSLVGLVSGAAFDNGVLFTGATTDILITGCQLRVSGKYEGGGTPTNYSTGGYTHTRLVEANNNR